MLSNTIISAVLFWDDQDNNNAGWAYRLEFDDGAQEDGPCEGTDPTDAPLEELEALVVAHGGTWSRPSYHDGGSGHFEWRAE